MNPAARHRHRPEPAAVGRRAPTSGPAGTRAAYTEADTPPPQHPELHRPGLLRQLEQQAGPRLLAPPTATSATARSNASTCSTPASRTTSPPARSSPRSALVQVMETAAAHRPARQGGPPLLLQVINSQPVTDSTQQALVAELTTWMNAGGRLLPTAAGRHHLPERRGDPAARRLVAAAADRRIPTRHGHRPVQRPGRRHADQRLALRRPADPGRRRRPVDNAAQSHKGSSFQFGWWGYVSKDLRSRARPAVTDPLPAQYCGGGSLSACRTALLTSLSAAASRVGRHRLPGRLVLLGRQPVVRGHHRAGPARRHHPAADHLAEPADLPAGRLVHRRRLTDPAAAAGTPAATRPTRPGPTPRPAPAPGHPAQGPPSGSRTVTRTRGHGRAHTPARSPPCRPVPAPAG